MTVDPDFRVEFFKSTREGAIGVATYMKDRITPLLKSGLLKKAERDNCLWGLFLRATAMMSSVSRLQQPIDFQLLAAANRGLIEILVDMILIHHDKTQASAKLMRRWEDSAILRMGQTTKEYFKKKKLPIPETYKPRAVFMLTHGRRVQRSRRRLWVNKKGKTYHPMRWTNRDLGTDTKKADELHGTKLEEMYRTEYQRLCAHVHGSGLMFLRELPDTAYNSLAGLSYLSCADLAMECAKIICNDYGFTIALDELSKEWHTIKENRKELIVHGVEWFRDKLENVKKQNTHDDPS
jgi:hypothetical protein